MSQAWEKVEFQDFISKYGLDFLINNAPQILHSKKDKEHEAYSSLVAFFFVAGFLAIYIAISVLSAELFFNLILFVIIVSITSIVDVVLILNYLRSNVNIKLIESWIEIYKKFSQNNQEFYCFTYYPIFSGKCHPNKAKNIIYKLFQEEVLKSKIDVTQIEVYVKISQDNGFVCEKIGYFFQYGEGKPFQEENIDRNSWKYFPADKALNENYIAIANWDHQYEWRGDLALDFDKLHDYAPWVIHRWNQTNLKPISEENKTLFNWNQRNIESTPKLETWKKDFDSISYHTKNAYKDLEIVHEAIEKIIGHTDIETLRDIKKYLFEFKAYFRDFKQ